MKISYIVFLLVLSINTFAQRIEKEYWDFNKQNIKYEYQVENKSGVENGYYKAFGKKGNLVEEGTYKMKKKNGVWKSYDDYGRTFSIISYKNDTINGVYKQWCIEGYDHKSFLCGDYYYKDGNAIRSKKYYSNGKLSEDIDIEKNIENKWFSDGSPQVQIINGKKYSYRESPDYDDKRIVDEISFDTLGMYVFYSYDYGFSGPKYIDFYDKNSACKRCKPIQSFYYGGWDKIHLIYRLGGEEMQVDSIIFRKSVELYLSSPDPNNTRETEKVEYNYNTGDLKVIDRNQKSYWVYHYFPDPKIAPLIKRFDMQGNPVY